MLENVRFNAGETSKDDAERGAFADQLAALGRRASSATASASCTASRRRVYDVAQRLPHAMGGLVAAEIDVLRRLTEDPERPYVVVLGGSKVSDKLGVIDNLLGKADKLLIGGGMVFTFLKAQGHEVGKSLLEEDQLDICRSYLQRAEETGVEIVLPTDIVVDTEFPSATARRATRRTRRRDPGRPARPRHRPGVRRRRSPAALADARTVFWNGPMGVFEFDGVRRRHPRGRRGADRGRRAVRRRRRRLRGRRAPARLRRGRVRPHLHRWRRQPGVPRGQGAARHRPSSSPDPHPLHTKELMADTRVPLMAGNWKMNLNHQEAVVLVQKLAWTLSDKKHDYGKVEVVVVPPFTDLRSVQTLVDGDRLQIRYGAQDVSTHDGGAYTGEISAAMLAKLGCSYVVVGHSERREYHAETDAVVNAKATQGARRRDDPDRVRGRGARGPQGRASTSSTRWPRSTARWPG